MRKVPSGFSIVTGSSCMPNALVTNGWPKRVRSDQWLELELEEVVVEVVDDVGFLEADPAARLADQPVRGLAARHVGTVVSRRSGPRSNRPRGPRARRGSARASARCRPRRGPCPSRRARASRPTTRSSERLQDADSGRRHRAPFPVSSSWFASSRGRAEPRFRPRRATARA